MALSSSNESLVWQSPSVSVHGLLQPSISTSRITISGRPPGNSAASLLVTVVSTAEVTRSIRDSRPPVRSPPSSEPTCGAERGVEQGWPIRIRGTMRQKRLRTIRRITRMIRRKSSFTLKMAP
eukprot:1185523-Prorocentrum_minimum.AAC.6